MIDRDIDHVLLTRFNLPSRGPESLVRARPGWLATRADLFDRYCVPSVLAQRNKNFSWIIYFDPNSPAWLRERISRYEAAGVFRPVFRGSVNHEELLADIRQGIHRERSTLITTNLDNDDGLAVDFIERVQGVRTAHHRAAIYLQNGLVGSSQGVYLRRDRRNAFCSVRENWTDPATCWADWHNLLGDSMPVIEVGGDPAWLQVVHGSNVSNRIRGRLVAPEPYSQRFGELLADFAVPTHRDLVADRIVAHPWRTLRAAPRSAAKWLALKLFGKSGLDRIKLRVQGEAK
jgi:N-acetylglucosaminyl-diphospho-decaprenol L-rhamnosyltransferase